MSERQAMGRLLVACATTDGTPVAQDLVNQTGSLIERLPTACLAHHLSMSACVALREAELPQRVRSELEIAHRWGLRTHAMASLELSRIGSAFDDAGIDWVVAKGPVLSELLYPRSDLRQYGDLDLLVRRDQFKQAFDLLEDNGGRVIEEDWESVLHLLKGELNLASSAGIVSDLHWSMLYDHTLRNQFSLNDHDLLTRRRLVDLGQGVQVTTLDPVDTFIHLALHACLAGGHRLSWMRDIQLAGFVPNLDWTEVQQRSHKAGLGLPVGAMLQRVRKVLSHVGWPESFERELTGFQRWTPLLEKLYLLRHPQTWVGGSMSARIVMGSTRSTYSDSLGQLRSRSRSEITLIRKDPSHPWRVRIPEPLLRRLSLHPTTLANSDSSRFRNAYFFAVANPPF
jgi:Uncharacterised nucleotidyltransferase